MHAGVDLERIGFSYEFCPCSQLCTMLNQFKDYHHPRYGLYDTSVSSCLATFSFTQLGKLRIFHDIIIISTVV